MKETNRTIKVSEHIRLDTRPGSAKWQARVKLADGSWHRFSTKTESLERATEVAMKFFYTSEDRLKNNLPQSTRKFRRVAEFARDRMQEELRSGSGHIVYKDYITALDKYLIPFFGSYDVANINAKALVDFGKWRTEQLGRKAHHSTINTHNTALNRVLDEAEQRGWITHAIRPKPINDGIKTESRGSFTKEEYKKAEGDREPQEAQIANDTTPAQVAAATDQPAASKTSAHEKAFNLFDSGKLSEKALLIAVGAERSGFELNEDLRLRTLTAFEESWLSEDAMIKLLS